MDKHRIRLCARTSSQDVPVRDRASGGSNTIAYHTQLQRSRQEPAEPVAHFKPLVTRE